MLSVPKCDTDSTLWASCLIISQRDHIGEFNSAIFEIIDGRELERRAWSRHKHAIREFSLIKFDQRYVRAAS